jgi:hypothetical protein
MALDAAAQVASGLVPGRLVRVTFGGLAGAPLAVRVAALEDDPPPATPTATPDPAAHPSLAFEPNELEQAGCAPAFRFTGLLRNTGGEPDDVAANVTLAYAVTRGAEYVQSVSLSPAAWPAIGSGEAVPFDVAVSLNADWAAAPDGTEVKLQVFVEGETNRPGHHPGQLTVTLVALCATASPTASATSTPSPTATATGTQTATATRTPTATPRRPPPGGTAATAPAPAPTPRP